MRNSRKSRKSQKGGNTIRMLIYCHDDTITYRKENKEGDKLWSHEQGGAYKCSIIVERIIDMNGWGDSNIHIDTIDILPGGTFKEDGFSDTFIDKHVGKYDLVYLPDCAGDWYKLQTEGRKDFDTLLLIILSISRLVKKEGILVLSKFTEYVLEAFHKYDSFSDAVVDILGELGFVVEIDKFKNIPGCGGYFRYLSIYAIKV